MNINPSNTTQITLPVKVEPAVAESSSINKQKVVNERLTNQAVQSPNQNEKNARPAFAKERITGLQRSFDQEESSSNPSVAQYVETEKLPQRQELESLVGLDLFA